jgi:hypothetical protein
MPYFRDHPVRAIMGFRSQYASLSHPDGANPDDTVSITGSDRWRRRRGDEFDRSVP